MLKSSLNGGSLPSELSPLHRQSRKHRFQQYLYCCMRIRCRGMFLTSRCLETALVYLLISRSLHSNGSTRYYIFLRNVGWLSPDSTALYLLDLVFSLEDSGVMVPWNISWLPSDFTLLCPLDSLFGLEDGGENIPLTHLLSFTRLHGVISQKIKLLIAIAVEISNPKICTFIRIQSLSHAPEIFTTQWL
jgi:hypothetical protein